ncbi:MAG: oligopeptide transporter, OPT family [Candidatus Thermoplasmatota archaeon]|nr:oligopeptide transporter, OPT family [Candidatus Thermoplasmatota archaeon]
MVEGQDFVPYVPAEKRIAEFTIKAVLVGILLTLLFGVANVYLGLYAGMTVSASIPAAVISMGILKAFKESTILENNMAQTIASAGESLAAGLIFTMPALVIVGAWSDFEYWPIVFISLLGGALGILFMIPLRRALIIEEEELIYPEGVACDKVLEVGDRGGVGVKYVFTALGIGVIFKFLVLWAKVIKGTVEGAIHVGRSIFYFGSDMSLALVGVGYIVGFNIATLILIGGAMAYLVGIPVYAYLNAADFVGMSALEATNEIWGNNIRFMGIGAMIVGGIWSIISARHGIASGIRKAIGGYSHKGEVERPLRTDTDLPMNYVLIALIPVILGIFFLYFWVLDGVSISLVATVAMVIMGFFFVAVSSYIVGLVGSSNNPVSGMTICTVLFTALLMVVFGMTGMQGLIATMLVAGIVCVAACTAGDISQDLKTGYLVGATPRNQQIGQLIGVIAPAFLMPFFLSLLLNAYGFMGMEAGVVVGGTAGEVPLKAPQATLFASITNTIFTGQELPWDMIGIGAVIGVVLIIMDVFLKKANSSFRTHVMPVAVGLYLPLSLDVPIFIGGILKSIVKRLAGKGYEEADHRGVLTSSGFIAGEALTGIIVAGLIVADITMEPVIESSVLSIFLFALPLIFLIWIALKGKRA